MYSAENAGLIKFDFLGLKTLTVINNTQKLIRKKINVSSDIGLLIETLLMTPIAIILFYYLSNIISNTSFIFFTS